MVARKATRSRRSGKKKLLRFRLRLRNKTGVEVAAYSKEEARTLAREQLGKAVKRGRYRFPVRAVYQLKAAPSRRDPGLEDVSELRALMLDIFRRYRRAPDDEFDAYASPKRKQAMTYTHRPLRRKGPFGQRARYR